MGNLSIGTALVTANYVTGTFAGLGLFGASEGEFAFVVSLAEEGGIYQFNAGEWEKIAGASEMFGNVGAIAASLDLPDVRAACWFGSAFDQDPRPLRAVERSLSWYSEEPHQYRGDQREFPTLGFAVARDNKVEIYSLDSGAPALWMAFVGAWSFGNGTMLFVGSMSQYAPTTSLAYAEGRLYVGSWNENNISALFEIDFAADNCRAWREGGYSTYTNHVNISERNRPAGIDNRTSGPTLSSSKINDIALRVEPDAPRDPKTGMLVPTVFAAVGQEGKGGGGLNIILPDRSDVRRIIANTGAGGYRGARVALNEHGRFAISQAYGESYASVFLFDAIPENNLGPANNYDEALALGYAHEGFNVRGMPRAAPSLLDLSASGSELALGLGSNAFRYGGRVSQAFVSPDGQNKAVAFTSRYFASGYMGENVLAAIGGDNDQTAIVGGDRSGEIELLNGAVRDHGTGIYTLNRVDGDADHLRLTVPPGAIVRVTGTLISGANVLVRDGSDTLSDVNGSTVQFDKVGVEQTFWIEAWSGEVRLNLGGYPSTAEIEISKIEIVVPDRSVRLEHWSVDGTFYREPVADGADLCALRAGDANSALWRDFGGIDPRGKVSVSFWVSNDNGGTGQIFRWCEAEKSDSYLNAYLSGGSIRWIWQQRQSFLTSLDMPVPEGGFAHGRIVFDGGQVSLYFNGELAGSLALNGSITQTLHEMRARASCGRLLWLKVERFAPSAELCRWMYQREAALIGAVARGDGRATLYGASENVWQVRHDPITGNLAVGTEAASQTMRGLVVTDWADVPAVDALAVFNGMKLGA